MSCLKNTPPTCSSSTNCPSIDGCDGSCPDFQIKKGDLQPSFKVSIEDETGPVDLTDLVVEANMWANAKLKSNIADDDTVISFADKIGFYQAAVGDVIIAERARSPEQMQIVSFDEVNYTITVTRGHNSTVPFAWKRGTNLKIVKFLDAPAVAEMIYEDVTQVDGTVLTNQLAESHMVYDWQLGNTDYSGCFSFEFQLIKMEGIDVQWTRKFPVCGQFIVKICE